MLAHGAVLRSKFYTPEQVEAIVTDYRTAGLEPADLAMLAFAEKVVVHAYKVTPDDVAGLRQHGFTDEDILDIAFAAGARCFFSKVLDAVGAEPDATYAQLEPDLQQALTGGRPFAERDPNSPLER
jgi:alkylhydroperoxidase family enzyme